MTLTVNYAAGALRPVYSTIRSGQNLIWAPIFPASIISLANGVGSGQANIFFDDRRTVAASDTDDLDLAGGSLIDVFGVARTFVKVKALYVRAAITNTNDIEVGGGANPFLGQFNDASDKLILGPGDIMQWFNSTTGYPVTPGTGDILEVANNGGASAIYDIAIAGTDA